MDYNRSKVSGKSNEFQYINDELDSYDPNDYFEIQERKHNRKSKHKQKRIPRHKQDLDF